MSVDIEYGERRLIARVYAPTNDGKNADKEIFFAQLTTVMESASKKESGSYGRFQRTSRK